MPERAGRGERDPPNEQALQKLWALIAANEHWFADLGSMNSCGCRLDAADPECSYRTEYPGEHALVRNVLRLLAGLDVEDSRCLDCRDGPCSFALMPGEACSCLVPGCTCTGTISTT